MKKQMRSINSVSSIKCLEINNHKISTRGRNAMSPQPREWGRGGGSRSDITLESKYFRSIKLFSSEEKGRVGACYMCLQLTFSFCQKLMFI